jgi:FixJ family two-component response regulator
MAVYGRRQIDQDMKLLDKSLIAVVDDDESAREAIISLVRSLGYQVVAFEGPEAFLAFDRGGVGCLIADVQMPGMTGLDLHTRLVAGGETTPTILITAFADEGVRTRALRAGVKCFLPKPVGEEDLRDCLRSAIRVPETPRQP